MRHISITIALLMTTVSSTRDALALCDKYATTTAQSALGRRIMVSAAHPQAAAAGCRVLLQGGSAVDAAVAVQSVLAVVEPQSSGLSGGSIILYYDASRKKLRFFDGLSGAPSTVTAGLRTPTSDEQAALDIESFGSEVSATGRAVGVPGTVAVLELVHKKFGKTQWSKLFGRSILLANQGFDVAPYLFDSISGTASGLPRCIYPDLQKRYCSGDIPLPVGTKITNAELAHVLQLVKKKGAKGFYNPEGIVVQGILARVHSEEYKLDNDDGQPAIISSLLEASDFAKYEAVEREPLCQDIQGQTICSAPPPSFGGFSVIYQLELMNRLGVGKTSPGTVERVHMGIEASRLAQFDRRAYIGDPDFNQIPIRQLLAPDYLDRRAELFSPTSAINPIEPGVLPDFEMRVSSLDEDNDSTSNISIIDLYGDAISMTTTNNSTFGAQMEAMGMILNNVLTNFTRPSSISPGQSVNQMESGKRARTAMAPTLAINHDSRKLSLVAGAAGGGSIPDYVVQTILGVLVDDLDPQAALSQPHWSGQSITGSCANVVGARSEIETGTNIEAYLSMLESLGHPCARTTELRSGLTAIQVKGRRLLVGGADPRRDGKAFGF